MLGLLCFIRGEAVKTIDSSTVVQKFLKQRIKEGKCLKVPKMTKGLTDVDVLVEVVS